MNLGLICGSAILTAGFDGIARLWDHSGRLTGTFDGHNGKPIFSARKLTQNTFLVASQDCTISAWKVRLFLSFNFTLYRIRNKLHRLLATPVQPDRWIFLMTSLWYFFNHGYI